MNKMLSIFDRWEYKSFRRALIITKIAFVDCDDNKELRKSLNWVASQGYIMIDAFEKVVGRVSDQKRSLGK